MGERHHDIGVGIFYAEDGGGIGVGELEVDGGFRWEDAEEFGDEAGIEGDFELWVWEVDGNLNLGIADCAGFAAEGEL